MDNLGEEQWLRLAYLIVFTILLFILISIYIYFFFFIISLVTAFRGSCFSSLLVCVQEILQEISSRQAVRK